jgi:hypothetical protein
MRLMMLHRCIHQFIYDAIDGSVFLEKQVNLDLNWKQCAYSIAILSLRSVYAVPNSVRPQSFSICI